MGRLATINALYAEIIFPVIVNEFCCRLLFPILNPTFCVDRIVVSFLIPVYFISNCVGYIMALVCCRFICLPKGRKKVPNQPFRKGSWFQVFERTALRNCRLHQSYRVDYDSLLSLETNLKVHDYNFASNNSPPPPPQSVSTLSPLFHVK